MRSGLYLVHKPAGATSFSLVQAVLDELAARGVQRRKLPVCHGGTLDPFAEGLLILLAGEATRLFELLHHAPKQYQATVVWGAETDNGDPLGQVVATGDPGPLTPARLDDALRPFLGWTEQVPPSTSAKKVDGEPAYRRAHRGEPVELPPSRVYLHQARWIRHELPHRSELTLTCRGGYYVRALARDLGRALGCRAHLGALRRTAIGPYEDPSPGARVGKHGRELFPWYPSCEVTPDELRRLRDGGLLEGRALRPAEWPLPEGFAAPEPRVRAFDGARLAALLRPSGPALAMALDLRRGL